MCDQVRLIKVAINLCNTLCNAKVIKRYNVGVNAPHRTTVFYSMYIHCIYTLHSQS